MGRRDTMEIHKSKVVKSKSSNSTLTKLNQKNKKSNSNASFKSLVPKKRGVYVERKLTKILGNNENKNTIQDERAPPRPSRDKKLFLNSVLSLLSKSSTGTQYKCPGATNLNKKRTKKENRDMNTNTTEREKKKKYKSKVLNSKSYEVDQFEVLQSKRNINNTPSIGHSEISNIEEEDFDKIKWSFLPRLVKPDEEEIQLEKEKKLGHLVKEVMEGRMAQQAVIEKEEDLLPLLPENKKDTGFHEDAVETKFKADMSDNASPEPEFQSAASSKVVFEMDEAIVSKLNFGTECYLQPRYSYHYEVQNYEKPVDNHELFEPPQTRKPKQKLPGRTRTKKKENETNSIFDKYKYPAAHVCNADNTKRKSKKNNRRNLMNLLKQQLSIDTPPFEEPQNLYQALKQIAKNKRKSQKTIRFENSIIIGEDRTHTCMFKRRKVISSTTKSTSKHNESEFMRKIRSMSSKTSDLNYERRYAKSESTSEDETSFHSLEVFSMV